MRRGSAGEKRTEHKGRKGRRTKSSTLSPSFPHSDILVSSLHPHPRSTRTVSSTIQHVPLPPISSSVPSLSPPSSSTTAKPTILPSLRSFSRLLHWLLPWALPLSSHYLFCWTHKEGTKERERTESESKKSLLEGRGLRRGRKNAGLGRSPFVCVFEVSRE